jgi:hypothetical protein
MIRPEWAEAGLATARPTQIAAHMPIRPVKVVVATGQASPIVIAVDMLIRRAMGTAGAVSLTAIVVLTLIRLVKVEVVALQIATPGHTPTQPDAGVDHQAPPIATLAVMRIQQVEAVAAAAMVSPTAIAAGMLTLLVAGAEMGVAQPIVTPAAMPIQLVVVVVAAALTVTPAPVLILLAADAQASLTATAAAMRTLSDGVEAASQTSDWRAAS